MNYNKLLQCYDHTYSEKILHILLKIQLYKIYFKT